MRRLKRIALVVVGLIAAWALASYLVIPAIWGVYTKDHPWVDATPGITLAADGIPGDPLNCALVGSKREIMRAMVAAKWYPADPLSLKHCLEIAEAAVLKRPYETAPVSSLFLFGRKEDLAFEQPVGDNPRERHHVRFWDSGKDEEGRTVWIGAAVFDKHVGVSLTTGQITHVTDANVDAERDYLFVCLQKASAVTAVDIEADYHEVREGRNGGGDPWRTDGALHIGILALER